VLQKSFGVRSHLILPEIDKIPILTYYEAVKLLQENGNPVTMGDDLGLVSEVKLGQLVKLRNASDIFVIKDYPDTIKKFYTKNKPGGLTETFDVIVDGWELVSGAIRQTDGEQIRKSMLLSGIDINNYEFYISIVDKAVDHGGFCLGLDRLIAKVLDKEMVSDAVPFPRTYRRLIP
jgi:aspartyl/asparaginyl-tRNA synthetase